ncbi:MAG TPA: nuclear transport factor 2 family protein [Solirubrobacteraceae bacterium]|nr:nuclear transport factor 2 family protein [Solirubrobacteraceae bacterium]
MDNLELVRAIYANWERGNWSSVWWAHPDIEYVMVDEPGAEVHRGLEAMGQGWRAFLSAWEDYRVEALEYRRIDEERVLVSLVAQGRGRGSGVGLEESARAPGANVFVIRDGRVVRLDAYFLLANALADLGLDA